ncbi:RagB/SusD family nutrient uptake outer membrane protein [Sinomicrobium soli]|uniref:RagB/SusD family nutrient uptake outer membrane protein n=1 Tax=Sinomicrobium sp. N-1-3-6 TaxID=2219864 RepID=UPI000DCC8189|nr:RagB/SusD family nutrient uptake outer membrane protein [Sinomicrobium sp. N-1-3-6]RAV27535.1 RagB/SusD family nutrient uptake outer membrane protein [Sinomicrobium sp. N-1-3-6]
MKKTIYILILALCLGGCEDFLDREPTDILVDEQVWSDPELIRSFLANLYGRMQHFSGFDDGTRVQIIDTDDAMWSAHINEDGRTNNRQQYNYDFRGIWAYPLIRDLNIFIENIQATDLLSEEEKSSFLAEGRFLRAYIYFLEVRSMGGVPLVLESYDYDGTQDVSEYRVPRSTEAGIYDFIASEMDAVKDDLPQDGTSRTRANRWTALALKSRSMLYAGAIARYNNLMDAPITTPGGEVGIPADRAEDYYRQSLEASLEIIGEGPYDLYNNNADKQENFYEALVNKNSPEVIWAYDYSQDGKTHKFTFYNIPRSLREAPDNSSGTAPSLHLVETYDYLNGDEGELRTMNSAGDDYVYYDHPEDIFAGKDPRLWGTVIYPGAAFRGEKVSIQAGVLAWNGSSYDMASSNKLGDTYSDGGLMVGLDGPLPSIGFNTNTGFYIRKHLDTRTGSGNQGDGSDVWWVRFRLGEILLNAAEASFELGDEATALKYINRLRVRAGFPENSLTELSLEKIAEERQVELAFEDHRWWDLKRWRLSHVFYDGDPDSDIAKIKALWPYRVVRPDDPAKHNKYVFIRRNAPRFGSPMYFRLGNYYSKIPQNAINANPLLVPNPFH